MSSAYLPGVTDGLVGTGLLAVREEDVAAGLPRTSGRRGGGTAPRGKRRSLLTLAEGARPVAEGDRIVVYRPVLAGVAKVRDDGQIRVVGRAADFIRLGLLEEEINRLLGADAINRLVAEFRAAADRAAGGEDPGRVFTRELVVRVLVAGMLRPEASWDDVLAAVFGELAEVAFTAGGELPPTGAGFSEARRRLPDGLMDALCQRLLRAVRAELAAGGQPLMAGLFTVAGFDGTLVRLPDTRRNREFFGAGTDPAPFPHVRVVVDNDAGTRATLGYAYGPSSGQKDASEQDRLEQIATGPGSEGLARADLAQVGDRNFPGAARLRRLDAAGWKLIVRLPTGLTVRRVGDWLPDGSFLADLGIEDVLSGWRVVEYDVFADGVPTGDTYAVATNITDPAALSATQAADAYHARWSATETPLREQKATITGAGPGSGPMLRAIDPFEVDQELPAWILATSLVRAELRTVAAQATPARRGARADQPVLVRELSFTAAWHASVRDLGAATAGLPAEIVRARQDRAYRLLARRRNTLDRDRTRPRAAKSVSEFPTARPDITTDKVTYTIRICGPTPYRTPTAVTISDHTPEPATTA